jgi:RNA polymerase sigma-70 factor (ECF subfamily)
MMDETARLHWVATHILPLEPELRGWLRAHARTLTRADADDLLQEAYARLWTANLQAVKQPRAYFYTTVRNLLAEAARRARIVPMERMGEMEALRILSEEPGPERRASARQELERLLRAVSELPVQCRRAFELRKFEGLSQRQIAAAMGIAEKTVEKHLAKALMRLGYAMRDADEQMGNTGQVQVSHDEQRQSD